MAVKKTNSTNVADNSENKKELDEYKTKLNIAIAKIEELTKEREEYIKRSKLLEAQVEAQNKKLESILKNKTDNNNLRASNIFNDTNKKAKISLSYNFDNMPIGKYYSKYKRILRNAYDTTVIGNLEEGLNVFRTLKTQNIPKEYKDMIEKNIEDIAFYIKNYYYNSID